jgi:hypothetical protein
MGRDYDNVCGFKTSALCQLSSQKIQKLHIGVCPIGGTGYLYILPMDQVVEYSAGSFN